MDKVKTDEAMGKLKEAIETQEEVIEKIEKQENQMALLPIMQTCLVKTKHGKSIECKFWIHTEKYFQYYEPGFTLEDLGEKGFIIKGDTVIIPNHEIQFVIIRNAQSTIPENMFLTLGGKKKMIEVVSG